MFLNQFELGFCLLQPKRLSLTCPFMLFSPHWLHFIFPSRGGESFSYLSLYPQGQGEYLITVARQAPLSMGFSRQEYWIVLPFPSPKNLLDPGIEPMSPTLIGRWILHPWAICSLYLWIFISPSLCLEPRQKRREGKFLAFSSSKFGVFLINYEHPTLPSLSPIFTDLLPVSLKWTNSRDILGGPVVKTLNFQFRGHGFNSCLGN